MDLNRYIDSLSAAWFQERSETQMTLGKLIKALGAMPANAEVSNLRNAHSYRGYYSDLSFELGEGTRLASDLLEECQKAMGRYFYGWKGGAFLMGERTPVWIAQEGSTGRKLLTLYCGGGMLTADDE